MERTSRPKLSTYYINDIDHDIILESSFIKGHNRYPKERYRKATDDEVWEFNRIYGVTKTV